MNPIPILLSALRRTPVIALSTILLVALAVGLGTCVSLMEPALRRGTTAAADHFDVLAGAPGSEIQLVLSSVYLDATPLPVLSAETATSLGATLAADPGVAWFSPLLFGDTWQHHPVVGVNSAFVTSLLTPGTSAVFASSSDVWVGALVPLQSGDQLHSTHGLVALSEHDVHEQAYTVRGKLPATGTPWDKAILVSATSIWNAHGLHTVDDVGAGAGHTDTQRADTRRGGPVSALVIKPVSVSDAYRLRGQLRTERSLALFPAEVLLRLYASLGDVQALFTGMARLAQLAVLTSVLMALFAGMARRKKALSVLRALGAPRLYGALALWLEVMLLLVTGSLAGLALGYGACVLGGNLFAERTGILLPVQPSMIDFTIVCLTIGLGSLAALLPAVLCYRLSVTDTLRTV